MYLEQQKPQNDPTIHVYKALVLTILLYGAESSVTYHHHIDLLEQHCLCTILKIYWRDFVTNIKVLKSENISSIEALFIKTLLHWLEHISRMEDHQLPKIALYGELATGHSDRGTPLKKFKDLLKKSLTACCIDHSQLEMLTTEQVTWRHTIWQANPLFKNN